MVSPVMCQQLCTTATHCARWEIHTSASTADSGSSMALVKCCFQRFVWADLSCVCMQGQRDMDLIASNIEMQFDQTLIDMTM